MSVYLGIFIFLLNASLGFITVYKKRSFESIVFGTFSFTFGLWALSVYNTILTSSLFWGRTCFFSSILGIGSIFLFSLIFPNNRPISKTKLLITISFPIIFGIASYTDLMLKKVEIIDGAIIGTFGSMMSLYQFFSPIYIFGSVYVIFRRYKNASHKDKNKIGYALLGIAFFVIPAVMTNAVLPLWFNINYLNNIGPVFSIFMVGFIFYAIIKHQFLDIKLIIQRGLVYSVLLFCIILTYLVFVFTFEYFLQGVGESTILGALLTTCLGIFGVPPLKKYFQRVTDRFFFKDGYDYATVLGALTDVLNKNISLYAIVEKTTEVLKNNLKSESVIFSFKEKIPEEENSLIIRIQSDEKNIGYLILGEKRSGDPYTHEDMSLLNTFAKQAAIALEKASLYQQVNDYAKTLESKVIARTQEITAIQKEQETLMLEISHGLQTPLTIMKGELFFLRKQGYDTTRVDTIDASIDRISSFIYRFLSLSRLETAAINERIEINLSLLLNQIVTFFKQETNEKNIELTSSIATEIIVEGNKEELEELFSNLISNSIKYMSKDRVKKIHITLNEAGSNIIILLEDNGIGIRPENLPNLFKKFYRVKESETKGIQGTGLGLVICKKIVDKHNGTIVASSTFGEGTLFTITLPKK